MNNSKTKEELVTIFTSAALTGMTAYCSGTWSEGAMTKRLEEYVRAALIAHENLIKEC